MDNTIVKPSPWPKGRFFITKGAAARIAVGALGFFIGRSVMLDIVNPVAAAFLTALSGTGHGFYVTAFFILLGMATRIQGIYLTRYLIFAGLLCVINIITRRILLQKKKLYFTELSQGLAGALCIFTGGLSVAWLNGEAAGHLLPIALLEPVSVFLLTFPLCKASAVITAPKRRRMLSNEEIIGLTILFGCIIAGIPNIYIAVISIRYFLCFYFILLAAYLGDSAVAAAAGMLTGLLLMLTGARYWDASMAMVLSLAGLGGGLLKGKGKPYIFVSFAVAGGAAFYYINRDLLRMEAVYSLSFAGMLFMITPWDFNFHITAHLNPAMDNTREYASKIRGMAVERLESFSGAFAGLGKKIHDNASIEGRELIGWQLAGVSGVIKDLADEMDSSLRFKTDLEEKLWSALAKNSIDVESITVFENKSGRYEVNLKHKLYYNKKRWNRTVIHMLNTVLQRRMQTDDDIDKALVNNTRFIEEIPLKVSCGAARLAKGHKPESGDSYSFIDLKDGNFLLILSDGMGSGKQAREESASAVELLDSFLASGFDKSLAVTIVNATLMLNKNDECFTTMDICAVDLYTGETEFIKMGASPTFILRGGAVFAIRSSTLPIGILKDVDMDITRKKMLRNDILVMVTDGMAEAVNKEDWIADALRECHHTAPQDIADYLLSEAQRLTVGDIRDDMTVIVAGIWER